MAMADAPEGGASSGAGLPNEIETADTCVGISPDAFKGGDFDVDAYINVTFPDEKSLAGLDDVLAAVRRQVSSAGRVTGGTPSEEIVIARCHDLVREMCAAAVPEQPSLRTRPTLRPPHLQMARVDDNILNAVRRHGGGGVAAAERGVTDAEAAVEDLLGQVAEIERRAEASECMVEEICKGIRRLDTAKRNLTDAITSLRKLAMLVTTSDRLQAVAERREYHEAANLLQATGLLLDHFKRFDGIPKIAELRGRFSAISALLRQMVLDDFRRLGAGKTAADEETLRQLGEAIAAVEAMGPAVRQELVALVCDREVSAYTQIYGTAGPGGKIDNVSKRLDFIRAQLMGKGAQWALFPPSWHVTELLGRMLCNITRAQLSEMLDLQRASLQPAQVVSALKQTLAFEAELTRHFSSAADPRGPSERGSGAPRETSHMSADARAVKDKYVQASGVDAAAEQAASAGGDFRGLISGCFEEHLGGYVEMERSELLAEIDSLLAKETWEPEQGAEGVLGSADQLFSTIKDSLRRSQSMLRGSGLAMMHGVYSEVLQVYGKRMGEKLPKTQSGMSLAEGIPRTTVDNSSWHVKIDAAVLRVCCAVANTAEYCQDTAGGLADAVKRIIEQQDKERASSKHEGASKTAATGSDRVDASSTQDVFFDLKGAALASVVLAMDTRLEGALVDLMKMPWASVEEVGDHSAWVSRVHKEISEVAGVVGEVLGEDDLTWVCDRLVSSFVPRLEEAIGRCRKASEAGIQQMLLDVQAAKGALMEVPELAGVDAGGGYARLLGREVSRVEAILKAALAPTNGLVGTFLAFVPGGSGDELMRVVGLKGLKGAELAEVKREFERQTGQALEEAQGNTGSALMERWQQAQAKWTTTLERNKLGGGGGAAGPIAKDAWKRFFTGTS